MSEVEKMYENAGVLKECLSPCLINKTWRKYHDCPNCNKRENYPPFTAEKQLELIKWLAKNDKFHCLEIEFFIKEKDYKISTNQKASNFNEDFTETLASLINNLWQDLTDEEKQQVKGILE